MKRFIVFWLSSLLISLSLFAADKALVPKTMCSVSTAQLPESFKSIQEQQFERIKKATEDLNSPMGLAMLYFEALIGNASLDTVMGLLEQNPYMQDMRFPKQELATAYSSLKLKKDSEGEIQPALVVNTLIQNISVFRSGEKAFTKVRPYDSANPTPEASNQRRVGGCWGWASTCGVNLLLTKFRSLAESNPRLAKYRDLTDEHLRLAAEHFYGLYILNEIRLTLLTGKTKKNEELFQEGGNILNFMAYAKAFGAGIPEKDWKPIKAYHSAMWKDKFIDGLKKMAIYHHELLQENLWRNPAAEVEAGKFSSLKEAKDDISKEREELRLAAFNAVESKVEAYTDDLHVTIKVGNQELKPQEFFNDFVLNMVSELEIWQEGTYNSGRGYRNRSQVQIVDHHLNIRYESFPYTVRTFTPEVLDAQIMEELDQARPIYIAFQVPKSRYTDKNSGETHTVLNNATGELTLRGIESVVPEYRGGHAVVAWNYEKDAQGRIVYTQKLNSWGPDYGTDGAFHAHKSANKTRRHAVVFR